MGGSREFSVTVRRREVVAAALPLQEHWLPLSNLDLLLPSVDVGVFFCYKKSTAAKLRSHTATWQQQQQLMGVLKRSLAQVLVTYYPFAGEVVLNLAGEPELLCNNRGVDFIEAQADVELANLRLHNPDESVDKKLVPVKKDGVLCIQATALKCGGLVVACSFDHRVADAHSANMFFVSWAEAAQSRPISFVPSFRRSLLSPRRPGYYDESIDDLFVPLSSLPPPPSNKVDAATYDPSYVNRIYYIVVDDIARIHAVASACGTCKWTTLEAFTAYLWWILGGSRDAGSTCSMGVVVDGRPRLQSCSSMDTYFGNVLSIPYATLAAEELREMNLKEVADAVHACVALASTREHFLELIDWVEAHRPEPALARIYAVGGGNNGGGDTAVVVSSGRRFPVEKVDFGWGKPAFGSYHFPWGGGAGYVMPMPSTRGDGNWVVYVHLPGRLVEVLEAVAGDVFRPITADYLGFDYLSTIEMT
ncbi:hypothetical protein Taro_026105 [Colocasia esculenta]|uniref:Uncharacterized protein n=1 Tax=Colocasia esculenta TaxID=4460 RepID=A0A843VIJ5_COLES|nr:hypothetical protein [Colocasia esculenta]